MTMTTLGKFAQMNKPIVFSVIFCVLLYIFSVYFRCYIRLTKILHGADFYRRSDQETISPTTLAELKSLLNCRERDFNHLRDMRGEFWVLKNYVRARHGPMHCYEAVTFTTHATISYLDNVETLVNRWRAPVSLAIHAPGTDFYLAMESIRYLRNCLDNSDLITELVTFHIFFSHKHVPENIPDSEYFLSKSYKCPEKPPYEIDSLKTYMQKSHLLYPINVARNIARDAAMTHFVLACDISFYPSPHMASRFLKMIARNAWPLETHSKFPTVYPIAIFQLTANIKVPSTKHELQALMANLSADYFDTDKKTTFYHNIPDVSKWIGAKESEQMDIFRVRRVKLHSGLWSPVFIGTHREPHHDERLSWEGQKDNIAQAYVMCVGDYTFMTLKDAFLIHSNKLREFGRYVSRDVIANRHARFIDTFVVPQLKEIFGTKPGCLI